MAAGIAVLVLGGHFPKAEAQVDHNTYATLLDRHVHDNRVDYAGFKTDEALLDAYLDHLATIEPGKLSRPEAMAFYINAYNAWTIKLILTRYPDLESIKDFGGFFTSPWKKEFVQFNSGTVTLDHIEHDILRPRYEDPRVHFAINCASASCPPLQPEPFTAEKLDSQLDQATREFINDPASNYLEGGTLYVSRIFKWFGEDFSGDIVGFVRQYARGALKKNLASLEQPPRVRYLDYDWSLNDTGR